MAINIDMLEPQAEFYQLPHKYRAFVAGFGSGKTQTMVDIAILDSLVSSKALIGLFAPTYDLLKLITIPRIRARLDELCIPYTYNSQQNKITTHGKTGDFIFRSLDNPERIVGFELYTAGIDELDTLSTEHAEKAFNMIVGRCRQNISGHKNRINVYTTPEGFRFVYKRWVKDATVEHGMVQASTLSNPFLPEDYVSNLMANYPPQLREAYIEGKFVNLTSGSVYTSYDKVLNDCKSTVDDTVKNEPIYIGMDFNVGNMSGVVHVKRGDEYHAVDEILGVLDTPTMCQRIKDQYGSRKIYVYPDAAGNARKSTNGQCTDFTILQSAGFIVCANSVNPRVRDRINTVNAALCNGNGIRRYKVNADRCPTVSDNLQQQAWKNDEPDKSSGKDHTNDAIGYLIYKVLGLNTGYMKPLVNF